MKSNIQAPVLDHARQSRFATVYRSCLFMKPISTHADIETGLSELLKLDPSLTEIAKIAGKLPLRLREPGFLSLAHIIIGQLVSRAAADAIYARFLNEINPPTPNAYLKAGEDAWIRIGLSRAKQSTIAGLAEAIIGGTLEIETLSTLPQKEAIKQMTALKGIGPWTAEVYLLFCAGHRDIFPAGDLALREAVRHGLNLNERPSEKEVTKIAKAWSPQRGIAARLFWAYYKVIKGGKESQPL